MQITLMGWLSIPIMLAMFFMRYERSVQIFIVFSFFTTMSALTIGDNSVCIYLIMLVIVFVLLEKRAFVEIGKAVTVKFNLLSFFVVYAVLSLAITPLIQDNNIIIETIESGRGYVEVNSNQYTQTLYLLLAFMCYAVIYISLTKGWISVGKVEKALDCAYLIVLILGILQLFIPDYIANMTYRNHVNAGYHTYGFMQARISSSFGEPSMMSLFVTPLFVKHIIKLWRKPNFFSMLCIILNVISVAINQSSTFYFGIIAACAAGLLLRFRNIKTKIKFSKSRMAAVFAMVIAVVLLLFIFRDYIGEGVGLLYDKLFQKGTQSTDNSSGTGRMENFMTNFNAFLQYPITGVGWGECRSKDMLSSLLVNGGLIGTGALVAYLIRLLIKLWKTGTQDSDFLFIAIITMTAILFISVPELYYFLFWIYLAMAEALIKEQFRPENIEVW